MSDGTNVMPTPVEWLALVEAFGWFLVVLGVVAVAVFATHLADMWQEEKRVRELRRDVDVFERSGVRVLGPVPKEPPYDWTEEAS